ncbi:MAG TPA: imidazoleglycerol-phosphate dehydratase HisB [Armatimonadetes bacterium]|nr:imidazoleglycerol-phosphate dehydratase HisB [Armatimonadota bacterium]
MTRQATVERITRETKVTLALNLDGTGHYEINTSIGFLDHMLELFSKHGLFDLKVDAVGDTQVDFHHLTDDLGICLGQAIKQAVGEKKGLVRYGTSFVPMDEALVSVHLDLSGRPYLDYQLELEGKIGEFDAELLRSFFYEVAVHAGLSLHLRQHAGVNQHHLAEAAFKAFGRALDAATRLDERLNDIPSTKGVL